MTDAAPARRQATQWRMGSVAVTLGPLFLLLMIGIGAYIVMAVEVRGRILPMTVGCAVALVAWMLAWSQLRHGWIIADTPTVAVKAVPVGLCELKGRINATEPLMTHFTQAPAAYCDWQVEELQWQGKSRHWTYIEGKREVAAGTYVYDDTGSIWVDIDEAMVRSRVIYKREVLGARPRRRHVERALLIGTEVYVLGNAALRDDAPVLAIGSDRDTVFVVSDRSERYERVLSGVVRWVVALVGLAAGALGLSLTIVDESTAEGSGGTDLAFVPDVGGLLLAFAALYLGAFVLVYVIWRYNRLVATRVRAEHAWSLIDVQLSRRATLIPQLAEVVRQYAGYERDVLAAVTYHRRSAALPSASDLRDAARVAGAQDAAGAELIVIAEQYPNLQASENFLALQRALIDANDRVALARRFYNDALQIWRDRSRVFPWSLLARFVRGPALEPFDAASDRDPAVHA